MRPGNKKTEELEMALDICLQQLAAGKWSLGQCLAQYPQYAAELRPLLETALRLQQGKSLRAPGATRDRARAELAQHMHAHPRRKRKTRILPNPAAGLLLLALTALFCTTAFAQAALPGESLYPLKLSSERVWRLASPDPVHADVVLSERRARELLILAHETTLQQAPTAAQARAFADQDAAYTEVLDRLSAEVAGPQGMPSLQRLQRQQLALAEAGLRVPKLDHIVTRSLGVQSHAPVPVVHP